MPHTRYKATLYPYLKTLEKWLQTFIFSFLKTLNPRFNSFRSFGIPSGWATIETKEVHPSFMQQREIPHTFETHTHQRFQSLDMTDPPLTYAKIPFGIQTCQAATLSRKGKLVEGFTQQFTATNTKEHKLFTFRKERMKLNIPHFEGEVMSLTADCQQNYYHWLFDVLPKISAYNPVHYYYVDQSLPFQRESLKMAGIPKSKIIPANEHPYISADLLIPVSFSCESGGPSKWATEFVQKTFARPKKGTRRLYISRKNASMRRIVNEEEITQCLKEYGFEIIYCDLLSFKEQIEAFSEAQVILAPHGAGLSNMVFAPKGTRIIEIYSPRSTCICYWSLANTLRFPYSYFRSIDDPSTYARTEPAHDHLLVDLSTLKRYL